LRGAAYDRKELALPVFQAVLLFQIVDSIGIILGRALQGAGDVLYVMYAELLTAWGACLPVAWLGGAWLQGSEPLLGVWLGWVAYSLCWAGAMTFRWRGTRWRGIEV